MNDVQKFQEVAELANELGIRLIFGYTLPTSPDKFTAPFGVQVMIDILNGMKQSAELNVSQDS
jgi:hypothetical protein